MMEPSNCPGSWPTKRPTFSSAYALPSVSCPMFAFGATTPASSPTPAPAGGYSSALPRLVVPISSVTDPSKSRPTWSDKRSPYLPPLRSRPLRGGPHRHSGTSLTTSEQLVGLRRLCGLWLRRSGSLAAARAKHSPLMGSIDKGNLSERTAAGLHEVATAKTAAVPLRWPKVPKLQSVTQALHHGLSPLILLQLPKTLALRCFSLPLQTLLLALLCSLNADPVDERMLAAEAHPVGPHLNRQAGNGADSANNKHGLAGQLSQHLGFPQLFNQQAAKGFGAHALACHLASEAISVFACYPKKIAQGVKEILRLAFNPLRQSKLWICCFNQKIRQVARRPAVWQHNTLFVLPAHAVLVQLAGHHDFEM